MKKERRVSLLRASRPISALLPRVSVNPDASVIITPRIFTVPRADNIGGGPPCPPSARRGAARRLVREGRVSLLHPATAAAAAVGFVPPLSSYITLRRTLLPVGKVRDTGSAVATRGGLN